MMRSYNQTALFLRKIRRKSDFRLTVEFLAWPVVMYTALAAAWLLTQRTEEFALAGAFDAHSLRMAFQLLIWVKVVLGVAAVACWLPVVLDLIRRTQNAWLNARLQEVLSK